MKKLDKYIKVVRKIKGDLDELKKFGFKIKLVSGMTGSIYVNKKTGVVIKENYRVNNKKPRLAIPTINVKVAHTDINIQPLANVSYKARKKAIVILQNTLSYREYNMMETDYDMHDENVAMYRNKAVVIDW